MNSLSPYDQRTSCCAGDEEVAFSQAIKNMDKHLLGVMLIRRIKGQTSVEWKR